MELLSNPAIRKIVSKAKKKDLHTAVWETLEHTVRKHSQTVGGDRRKQTPSHKHTHVS